ncbi:hypothetical protein [Microlunatus sp. GCM10028923]|uniref:hypothetical protein n=1 Tax=Microlunatus sp. GCM10028923 TaxID=3273400 RepID=UPI0036218AE6
MATRCVDAIRVTTGTSPCAASYNVVYYVVEAAVQLARPVAVQARALLVLQFQELEQAGLLGRGRHHAQHAAVVGQHQAGPLGIEQVGAPGDQFVQEFDDIEVADQAVGEPDEKVPEPYLLRFHCAHLPTHPLSRRVTAQT